MFDTIKFLRDSFVDAHGVVSLLQGYRLQHPPHDTARKWFERGTVPSTWFPLLLIALELEHGRPAKLHPYLIRG